MLYWMNRIHGMAGCSLRYFNAAGAHPDGHIGEDHRPETHLIPLVLQVALGQREQISVFGDDYPTPDGSCIRDYIHVMDLAEAHILALEALAEGENRACNLGSGHGYSVREVLDTARQVTGHAIPAQQRAAPRWRPRRAGSRQRAPARVAGLDAAPHDAAADHRQRLELASQQSAGLPGVNPVTSGLAAGRAFQRGPWHFLTGRTPDYIFYRLARARGKPLPVSEAGCMALSNPCDMTLVVAIHRM